MKVFIKKDKQEPEINLGFSLIEIPEYNQVRLCVEDNNGKKAHLITICGDECKIHFDDYETRKFKLTYGIRSNRGRGTIEEELSK